MATRLDVLAAVANAVVRLPAGQHPRRVGVDGRSAAGKSAFADGLATQLRTRGMEVLTASIDDFHHPGHRWRSERGEWTPQLYYDEGFDYESFRRLLLQPLGPAGDRRCRTAIFDSYHDRPLPEEWREVSSEAIAVVDGTFLLRPELSDSWDLLVWLDVDHETTIARARGRDIAWVPTADEVEQRFRRRVIPTHDLYEALRDPRSHADFVVDNRDFDFPMIIRSPR